METITVLKSNWSDVAIELIRLQPFFLSMAQLKFYALAIYEKLDEQLVNPWWASGNILMDVPCKLPR